VARAPRGIEVDNADAGALRTGVDAEDAGQDCQPGTNDAPL
jgi:hypothetical protein